MKKIYTLFATMLLLVSLNAQNKFSGFNNLQTIGTKPVVKTNNTKAPGDTVFFFDGYYMWGNGLGTGFTAQSEDIDALNVAAAFAGSAFDPTSGFVFFYDLHSVTNDSIFYAGATSWFNPAAQADNWLEFGPINVPASGANLSWTHNIPDGAYRDGYKVKISTTGMANYTDFTNAPIFTVADNDPSTIGDTVNFPDYIFASRSTSLSAYAGQSIYLAFHHDGNDQFILYLKDILISEATIGVEDFENGVKFSQNMPNPFKGITAINYELENAANITFNVFDVTGKKVAEIKEGMQTAGKHVIKYNAENLSAGVYYYSVKVNENTTSAKKMVIVK